MASIAHVDADCFYVSAERVRLPGLRGMPVGILGNHGACIIAKSYEMKAMGVTTGMPIWEALPLCPDGIYVKRDFTWYEVLSRKMLAAIKRISPRVEYYSIDEMFFQSDAREGLAGARALQNHLLAHVGVPTSVGIAPTKTLAKLCSDAFKPMGCHVLTTEDDRLRLLSGLPVTEITGIASRSATKLARYGITTCEQFAAADRRLIRGLLTKKGEDLWWELNGTPVMPIAVTRPRHKFVARGGSLGRATGEESRLRAFVVRNTERLVEALNFYQLGCDQLILELSFHPRGRGALRESLMATTWDFDTLAAAALRLMQRMWQPPLLVHYMHVIAGRLRDRRDAQLCLFARHDRGEETLDRSPADAQLEQRDKVIDRLKHQVNESLGRFALRSGATLPLADVYGDPANAYDICDIYGKTCF